MKVNIIASNDGESLINAINEFIKDKIVIDIKYQAFPVITNYNDLGVPSRVTCADRALIMYKEIENNESM